MRVRWPVLSTVVAAGLLLAVATAPCVYACSCMEPQPLSESVQERTVVAVGTVGVPVSGRYPFVIERWYRGPDPQPVLTLQGAEEHFSDGQVVINTCGRSFTPGQVLILVGELEGNQLSTSICSLGAEVASADGQKLVQEAQRLFGPGVAVAAPLPSDGAGSSEPSSGNASAGILPVALIGMAIAGLSVLLIGIGLAYARSRRGAGEV